MTKVQEFRDSNKSADEILSKMGEIPTKGKTIPHVGVQPELVSSYGIIAERLDRDRKFDLSRYTYASGPNVSVFAGGFLDHNESLLVK